MPFFITALVVGIVCTYFGYHIYYNNKYDFLTKYFEEKRQGVIGEDYSKKVGRILLTVGKVLITIGLVFVLIKVVKFMLLTIFILIGFAILLSIFYYLKNKIR